MNSIIGSVVPLAMFSRWAGFCYAFYLHNWCIINILQRSTITQDEMPPDYLLERRNASKVLMAVEEKYLRQLRRVRDIKVLPGPLPLHVFFLRVSTGMAGWGLVVHWDCLWQEPSWAEALFGVYPKEIKEIHWNLKCVTRQPITSITVCADEVFTLRVLVSSSTRFCLPPA